MAEEAVIEDVTTGADDGAGAAAVATGGKETGAAAEVAAKAGPGPEALLDGAAEGADDGAQEEDWRARHVRLAGGDEALAKRLSRYSSEANWIKASIQAHDKLRAGEGRKALAPDAKPEEVEAWRKENDLPTTPEDMLKAAPDPDGFVFGEADKPFLDQYAKAVLGANGTPDEVARGKAVYASMMEQAQAQRTEADKAYHAEAMDVLLEEYGSNAARKAALNGIDNFLQATAPDEVRDAILGGRGRDGNLLRNNPHMLKWLSQMSHEINPAASLVPAGTTNPGKTMSDEIAALERDMSTDGGRAYWSDPAKQKRYAELVTAREKMNARAA